MLKGIFPLMRQWYHSSEVDAIRDMFGSFPLFWQDLAKWDHTRILKKIYLTVTEKKEAGLPVPSLQELVRNLSSPPAASNPDVDQGEKKDGNGIGESGIERKKRRNRWGDPVVAEDSSAAPSSDSAGTAAPAAGEEGKKIRKSRWSTEGPAGSAGPSAPPAPSQDQLQQTIVLRMQLQRISDALLTVAADAARIEQDPNRSPSVRPHHFASSRS